MDLHLLDLLVDGPSSVAALVFNIRGNHEVEVGAILVALEELELRQLVCASQMAPDGSFHPPTTEDRQAAKSAYGAWLPSVTVRDDVSFDEVGLWYRITEAGRAEWSLNNEDDDANLERWVLDESSDQEILEIRATNELVAESVLKSWLDRNNARMVRTTRTLVGVPFFVLRDGTKVFGGVLLRCRYLTTKVAEPE